jgi:hypothetical protein
LVAKREDLRL